MRLILLIAAVLCSACSLTGCGYTQVKAGVRPLATSDMDEDMQARRTRAVDARDMLMKRLGGTLKFTLEAKGPVAAIAVCKQAAPSIAAGVSAENDLKIGRTSFRLRNSSNQVPAWAQPAVDQRVKEPSWFVLENGDLGGLLPIMIQPLCTTCHGARDAQDEELRSALRKHYPDDEGVGFSVGDLRGWFWVEVPPKHE